MMEAVMRAGYPEAHFSRSALPAEAVMAAVAACRSDDAYRQVQQLSDSSDSVLC